MRAVPGGRHAAGHFAHPVPPLCLVLHQCFTLGPEPGEFEHGDGGFSHRPAHHGYAGIGFHPGTLNPMAATSKDIDRPHQDHDVRLPFRPNFLLLWNRQSSAVFCQSPAHMSHCLHSSSMQLGAEQDARAAQTIQHCHEPVWIVDLRFLPVHHPQHTDSFSVCDQPKWK